TYPTEAQSVKNGLFLQEPTSKVLPTIFDGVGIKHRTGFTLNKVDPDKKIAYSQEGEEIEFDILMSTPPFVAVEFIRNSGLSQALD
ncbi:NAD(P)/FAD-dependent oxidoreductase, partial [Aliarcobacter lanthieri]